MIEDISEWLLPEFADGLQASLVEPGLARAPEPAPLPALQPGQQLQLSEPVKGLSLVGSVLWQRVRTNRALGAVLAALVLAWLLVRRRLH
jgi:hypothetical protein